MDWVGVFLEPLRVAVGPQAAAFAIAAIGLNVHFGHTGLLNFGHAAFLMLGAYGVAITVEEGWSIPLGVTSLDGMVLGLLVGVAAAVLLALALGLPALRLRADYLAISTIAAAEVLRLVARSNWARPFTGGVFGLTDSADQYHDANPIDRGVYGWEEFVFSNRVLWVMVGGWLIALLCTLLVRQLVRSPWGRVLRAIREDEDAVRSLGKNVFAFKLQSLVLGGVIGALAGVVLLTNQDGLQPDQYQPVLTFFFYAVVILGGAGSVWGPVVGATIYWFLVQLTESLLTELIINGVSPFTVLDSQDVAALRFVLVGVGIIALMIWRPQGLFGKREEIRLGIR